MNEKTKKIITLVFSAVISLAVSIAALLTGIPASEFIPDGTTVAANGGTVVVEYDDNASFTDVEAQGSTFFTAE